MEPMKCYHCGRGISDIWDVYQELLKTDSKETHSNKFFDTKSNISLLEIFKKLGVEKYCCRSILTTSVNFHDLEY